MPGLSPGQPLRMPPKPMLSQPPKPGIPAAGESVGPNAGLLPGQGRAAVGTSSAAALSAISRARSMSGPGIGKQEVRQGPIDNRPIVSMLRQRPEAPRRHSSQQFRYPQRATVLTAFPNRSASAVATNVPGGLRAVGVSGGPHYANYMSSRYVPPGAKAETSHPPISTTQSSDRANWEILGVRREVQREPPPDMRGAIRGRGRELERPSDRKVLDRVPERLTDHSSDRQMPRLSDHPRLERQMDPNTGRPFERQGELPIVRGHRESEQRRVDEDSMRRRMIGVAPSVDSPFKGRTRGSSIPRAATSLNQTEMHQGDAAATVTLRQYQEFLNALTQESLKREMSVPSSSGTQASGEPRRARGTILLTPEKYKEFLDVVAGNSRHPRSVSATNASSVRGAGVNSVGTAASEAVLPYGVEEDPVVVATSYPARSFSRRPHSSHMRNSYESPRKSLHEKAVVPSPRRDLVPANQPRELVPTTRSPRELITTRTTTREMVPQRNVVPAVPSVAPSPLMREVRSDIQALRMDMKDIKADVRGLRVDMSKLKDLMARSGGGSVRRGKTGGGSMSAKGSGGGIPTPRRSETSPRRSAHEKRAIAEAPSPRYSRPSMKKLLPTYAALEARTSKDVGRKGRRKKKKRRRRRKHCVEAQRRTYVHQDAADKPPKQMEERIIIPTVVQQNPQPGRRSDEHYPIVTAVQGQPRTEAMYPVATGAQMLHRNENYPGGGPPQTTAGRRPIDENRPNAGGTPTNQRRAIEENHPNAATNAQAAQKRPSESNYPLHHSSVRRLTDDNYIRNQLAANQPRRTIEENRAATKEQTYAPASPTNSPPASPTTEQRRPSEDSPPLPKKLTPKTIEEFKKRAKKGRRRPSDDERWLRRLDESLQTRKQMETAISSRKQFEDTLGGT